MTQSGDTDTERVILFDGECNLCNGFVGFVLPRVPAGNFKFASLQSPFGQELLSGHALPTNTLDSVVLSEEGRVYSRSTAVLRILRRLSGLWPLLYAFFLVPRPIRDAVYDFIGRNRYRWFGRRESCLMPTPENRKRFLDSPR
jgi:predicted DCC family thiol-disulfide oxidoreductase YuxK